MLIEVSRTHNRLVEERYLEFLKLSFIVEISEEVEPTGFENWASDVEISDYRVERISSGFCSAFSERANHISKVVLTECQFMDVTPDEVFFEVARACGLEVIERTVAREVET